MADATSQSRDFDGGDEHPLKTELYSLLQMRCDIQDFLFSELFDGVRYSDLQNRETEWISPRFWRALGYAAETMPHNTAAWQSIADPDDLKISAAALEKHCADPDNPYDQTVRFKHAQGHIIWLRCCGLTIRDDNGGANRLLVVHTDVSTQKIDQQDYAEQIAQHKLREEHLEFHNQSLKDFASVIAHDLQAPLRQTTMNLSLLEAELEKVPALTDSAHAAMDNMDTLLDRMRRIVKSLHELYRVSAFDLDPRPSPIGAVIHDAAALAEEYLDARGAQLNVGEMPTLPIDPDLITQVFQNILANACKYCDADQVSIDITFERDPSRGRVLIFIDNNGSGIPADSVERIFEPYRRLEHTDEIEGSGIGLALCRRIMTLHRGAVYVDPQFTGGARFVLSFPV